VASPSSKKALPLSSTFHEALKKCRQTDYVLQMVIANEAGVTVGQYNAMELGEIPMALRVYAAGILRWPQLNGYPAPPADPVMQKPVEHPAVTLERKREEQFMALFTGLNVGKTNKAIIRSLLILAATGEMRIDDINRLFGE